MKINLSFLLQVYFFSIAGIIMLLIALLPHYVVGAVCFKDSPYEKIHTEEMADISHIAALLARISHNTSGKIEVNYKHLTAASIAKVEVIRDGQTEVLELNNGTLPQVLKDKKLLKLFSDKVFETYDIWGPGLSPYKLTNNKRSAEKDGEPFFTMEVMPEGGILFKLGEKASRLFDLDINWGNVYWTDGAEILLRSSEEAAHQESTYRQQKENRPPFKNVFIGPEHTLLALATRRSSETFTNDFQDLFTSELAPKPTIMRGVREVILGFFFNSFSARARELKEIEIIEKELYEGISNVRDPERRNNGVDTREYPSNRERPKFFNSKKEQDTISERDILHSERAIPHTNNLNKNKKNKGMPYILTEGLKQNIRDLVAAINNGGIIDIFGEPNSGRRTLAKDILPDLINATHDSSHRHHKLALELIPENLRNISIHEAQDVHVRTEYRGSDSTKFDDISKGLVSFEGRAVLLVTDLSVLLKNTNTSENKADLPTSLINSLQEPIREGRITLIIVTNKTQQTQLELAKDIFDNRRRVDIPTLGRQEILEYLQPLAENRNNLTLNDEKKLFTPEQLEILVNEAINIADRYPTLTKQPGLTGAKKVLEAVFDNAKTDEVKQLEDKNDLLFYIGRIVSHKFANGVMDIGKYTQENASVLKVIEEVVKEFVPGKPEMLEKIIRNIIHPVNIPENGPIIEIFLGPPGTGKTTLIHQLALALGMEIIMIEGSKIETAEDIKGSGPESLASKIRAAKGPALIYINEANLLPKAIFTPETSSLSTQFEGVFEKGVFTDVNGYEVYTKHHHFFLDMNLNAENAGKFNTWRAQYPSATSLQINVQLASLVQSELGARTAYMSRAINQQNIHSFEHLDTITMAKIITIRVDHIKNELLEQGLNIHFERSAIELLAEYAIEIKGVEDAAATNYRDYGARPILARINTIINVLNANLIELIRDERTRIDTEIDRPLTLTESIMDNRTRVGTEIHISASESGQLSTEFRMPDKTIRRGQYDLDEGLFSFDTPIERNDQQSNIEEQPAPPPENEPPPPRFNFFRRP